MIPSVKLFIYYIFGNGLTSHENERAGEIHFKIPRIAKMKRLRGKISSIPLDEERK